MQRDVCLFFVDRFEREFAATRALQPKDGLEDMILGPSVLDHELHFLTNTKGWKDQDDGHRRDIVAGSMSEASVVQGVKTDAVDAVTVLDENATDGDVSTTGKDVNGHTLHEEIAAASVARLEGVGAVPLLQSPTINAAENGTADAVAVSEATNPAPQPLSESAANVGDVRVSANDTAGANRTVVCSTPATDDVAGAAAAAASIASAAAEMFRGQLTAISNSKPYCVPCT